MNAFLLKSSISLFSSSFPLGTKTVSYTYSLHSNRILQSKAISMALQMQRPHANHSICCSQKICYHRSQAIQWPKVKPSKPKLPVHTFLDAHQLTYLQAPNVYKVKYCPFCPKPHHEEPSNLHTLNIHKQYGYYHCFRCSAKGNWLEFREKILGIDSQFTAGTLLTQHEFSRTHSATHNTPMPSISEAQFYFYKQNIDNKDYSDVLEYLHSRGFTDKTIKDYNLGAGTEDFFDEDGIAHKIKLVYFPMYKINDSNDNKVNLIKELEKAKNKNFHYNNTWTQLVKTKMRGASKETKKYMRQYPIGSSLRGIFGFNLIKDTDRTLVVTQGQFDAMAVYQQTGYPAVSLPQGATNLSDNVLPFFDRFQKIILWMDNDEAGLLNTSKIADKLGLKRTHIVSNTVSGMKDANDFLLKAPSMISEFLNKARTIPDSNITNFAKMRQNIKSRMVNEELGRGVQVSWLPYFNQKVKGVRLGELTVVSGPTGSGKTTFLSQLFLDLCERDIGVLWGSFEIRNQILITHMLSQFANRNLAKQIQRFEYFANKFQKLPLHLMNFYGSTNIQKILSTIVYSIQKFNIHMVVLDTLQFMLSEQGEGYKKFELQDSLMAKLRQISIKYNVHIAIVIHPRKTDDNEDIGIHSIYGTSKATQEADNIWVMQNREGYKIFDIKKNRYDGELGRIPLGFNKESKKFFQLKRQQFQALKLKEKTLRDIIRDRQDRQNKSASAADFHAFDEQIQDQELKSSQAKGFSTRFERR